MTVEQLVNRIDDGVNALERIATALEEIRKHLDEVTDVNDAGHQAVRVLGEFVGGDGDVTVDG